MAFVEIMSSEALAEPSGSAALIVRPAEIDDKPTLVAFNLAMAMESERLELDETVVTRGVEQLLRDATKGRYYVAEMDGSVVGQLMTTPEWTDWRNGWFWWIQSVYVMPQARSKGVFTALYRHVRQEAHAAENVRGLKLYVDRDNQPAIHRYHRVGMQESHYRLFEEIWG